jgi:hypothetical protein
MNTDRDEIEKGQSQPRIARISRIERGAQELSVAIRWRRENDFDPTLFQKKEKDGAPTVFEIKGSFDSGAQTARASAQDDTREERSQLEQITMTDCT